MANTNIDARQAALNLIVDFLNHELGQVAKDREWIKDNVTDPDKREKRLSYQDWREEKLTTLIAVSGIL
jgi:hypothetical protein